MFGKEKMLNQGEPFLKEIEKNERECFLRKHAKIIDDTDFICSSLWIILYLCWSHAKHFLLRGSQYSSNNPDIGPMPEFTAKHKSDHDQVLDSSKYKIL